MKRSWLSILVVASSLAVTTAAQTTATSDTKASATQNTAATAGQQGASAASSTGATASQATQATTQGATAKTAASATNQTAGALQVPAGTKIPAVLSKSIDSKKAKAGDKIEARTVADIVSAGKVMIPRNSKLIGRVTEAQAKSKGSAESKLGIVFDRLEMKKGQVVPIQANIQAIAKAVQQTSIQQDSVEMGSAGSYGGGASGSAGGGLVGGAAGTAGSTVGGVAGGVGGVADSATSTAGNVGSGVGSTVGSATSGTVGAAGNSVGVAGTLNSNSTGVVGLKDLQLTNSTSATGSASVMTSSGKSVKLDSGSQLMLNVTGSAQAQ